MTALPDPRYRPEIDGLRAIAVAAVVAFHADPRLMPGGYLGVDIFFVISGYLITWIIASELQDGRYSVLRFYERRARRILPPLFLVLAACIPAARWLMLPGQFDAFGDSLAAALAFCSNVLFWQDTGYFVAAAETKPLLHSWTLAVEEQFYLVFPLILALAWRWGGARWMRLTTLALGAASLALAVHLAQRAPAANFYLLPSRAWELMAGAALALMPLRLGRASGPLALAGAVLVAGSFALFSARTPMPSLWGVIPVGGTVLLIAGAQRGTIVARALSARPLVELGLISYGVYLWHWPLFAFARLRTGGDVNPGVMIALVGATLMLAVLSWRFVERPFRRRGPAAPLPVGRMAAGLAVWALALVVASQTALVGGSGLAVSTQPGRMTPAEIEAKVDINYGLSKDCEFVFTLSPNCRTSDAPELLLWGDSYAMHLANALRTASDWRGMIQHTKSTCAPILGLSARPVEYEADWADGCLAFNEQVFDWLSHADSVHLVVLSSTFNLMFRSLKLSDGTELPPEQYDVVRARLIDTVQRIRALGKDVVIVSPTPFDGDDIGQCLAATELRGGDETACDFPRAKIDRLGRVVMDFLKGIEPVVPVIDIEEMICGTGTCRTRVGDVFVFRDSGHLSIEGSAWLGRTFDLYGRIRAAAADFRGD